MSQKPVLGKGLASLLPGGRPMQPPTPPPPQEGVAAAPVVEKENRERHLGISIASPEDIVVNTYQPRRDFDERAIEELAQSIRENGIIQPLVVRKTDRGYELIAGERRLRAARKAGLKSVPIVIRRSTDRESLELALIENIQRENLNCVDEAIAYSQLIEDFDLTQEELSSRVGKDRATIANHLRLLRLPEEILKDLRRQTLSLGHGKVLVGVEDPLLRMKLYREISEHRLSVREAEKRAQELRDQAAKLGAAGAQAQAEERQDPIRQRLANISDELSQNLSTRVELKGSDKRGKIVVHYATREELERLLSGMHNSEIWHPKKT